MKVLVACEESQAVCKAFRERGHEAAPRGASTGTQSLKNRIEKARIPQLLCEYIVDICEG